MPAAKRPRLEPNYPFKRTNAKGHREDCEHIEPLCGEPLLLHRLVMVRVRVRARAGVGVRVRR